MAGESSLLPALVMTSNLRAGLYGAGLFLAGIVLIVLVFVLISAYADDVGHYYDGDW